MTELRPQQDDPAKPGRSPRRKRIRAALAIFSVLVGAGVASYFLMPRPWASAMISFERSRSGLTSKTVIVGDHEVAYLEGGTGEAILMIHGFPADKDVWTRFARRLTSKYRVIALDLPGFGESPARDGDSYDIEHQAARVHAFTQAIGLTRYHLIGNSMGGHIAGVVAHHWPAEVATLALLDAHGVGWGEASRVARELAAGHNSLLPKTDDEYDALVPLVFHEQPWIPYPVYAVMRDRVIERHALFAPIADELVKDVQTLAPLLPNIPARTLVLWGDSDQIFSVDAVKIFQAHMPNATAVVMKDCGHVPMMERPAEAADHYLAFLTALTASR
jgi:pimeloyl-ACP methyl ester carboxylesterase